MAYGMTTSLIVNRLSIKDQHNLRLEATARGPSTAAGQASGIVWNPTGRRIIGQEEIDKQNDDNLTFMFEFRSLINSRLQTLITALGNALASDLDVAMNATNAVWTPSRSAMNGNTTPTLQDAGAARVTYNYMMGWCSTESFSAADIDLYLEGSATSDRVNPSASVSETFTNTAAGSTISVGGTTTLLSSSGGLVDAMDITLSNSSTFAFQGTDRDASAAGENIMDNSFESSPLAAQAVANNAKNLTEKILYDSLSSIEYKSVLTSGLFKNLIISASSSLPTGSQTQASLNISYEGSDEGGRLTINLDKFTAFYHS